MITLTDIFAVYMIILRTIKRVSGNYCFCWSSFYQTIMNLCLFGIMIYLRLIKGTFGVSLDSFCEIPTQFL